MNSTHNDAAAALLAKYNLSATELADLIAEMDDLGYSFREFSVVRFRDSASELRWFRRQFDAVGTMIGVADGGTPADPSTLLHTAREAFGEDVDVLW